MTVSLIHSTQDGDALIAEIARVSNPSNQGNRETAPRLVRYLIRHNHWSPFEMVSACVEINTTRDIGRQILRHRSFSFQEFSGRYAEYADLRSDRELRFKGTTNRQSSKEADGAAQDAIAADFARQGLDMTRTAAALYRSMLAAGVAPECARAFLPEGLVPTRMYMHGTIRSWIHYLQERTKPGVQKEHRLIAEAIWQLLEPVFPSVFAALADAEAA